MAYDSFLIAPFKQGQRGDLRPWLIPEDAFEVLENVVTWRGRVKKRFGTRYTGANALSAATTHLNSRVRVSMGAYAADPTTITPPITLAIGQQFSIGTTVFTVNTVIVGQFFLTTGAIRAEVLAGNMVRFDMGVVGPVIFFYPALPIMGLTRYEQGDINNQQAFAFDTSFAYEFNGNSWERSIDSITPTIPEWNGDNGDFFWALNFQGAPGTVVMFVSNFQVANLSGVGAATDDPIWTFQDDATVTNRWTPRNGVTNGFYFAPGGLARAALNSPFISTARIMVVFDNRLVLLNVVENDNSDAASLGIPSAANNNTHFPQRARWSFIGNPFALNAWYQPDQTDAGGLTYSGASFSDASTEEEIIGAEFIKDRLIVYFERSTWELARTGNAAEPFVWQQINTELGAESTFSIVPFDKAVLGIGNTGVHSCSGANVERIDDVIPDFHAA